MAQMDEQVLDEEIQKAKLGELVENCLVEAVRQKASDIHIVPKEGDCTEFYFRVGGKLVLWHQQEGTRPEAACAVVKDRSAHIDRSERNRIQDGFMERMIDEHTIRFRVNVLPVIGKDIDRSYERIVIRILDDRKAIRDLDKLGLQEQVRADLDEAIGKPHGLIFVTGPTGSGKSITLLAALHEVMDPSVNVLTLEDPVELLIEGASQIRIGGETTYDQAFRGILRHDPDVVMLGEIRDLQTAQIAFKLANTGHLTFSTLHTNDAVSAVMRLLKMGIEPTLVGSAIKLVLGQRLVRKLCAQCKAPEEAVDEALLLALGFTKEEIAQTPFYQPVGCKECRGGYRGRTAIHDSLAFTKAFRSFVTGCSAEADEEEMRQKAIESGMFTFAESAKGRLKDGVTSLEGIAAMAMWEA